MTTDSSYRPDIDRPVDKGMTSLTVALIVRSCWDAAGGEVKHHWRRRLSLAVYRHDPPQTRRKTRKEAPYTTNRDMVTADCLHEPTTDNLT